jgi:hypothetical protein
LGVAFTCVAENPVILANDAEDPQFTDDAIKRTLLLARRPIPESCKEQDVVSVHSVAPTRGPEIWKEPRSKKKIADVWLQHM